MGQIIDLSHFSIWLLILSTCKGFALFTIIHTLYKDKFNSFITLITTLISVSAWNIINQYVKILAEQNGIFTLLSYALLILFIFVIFAISIDTKTKNKITGSLLIFVIYILIWIGTSAFLSFIWSKLGYQNLVDNLPIYKSTIALTLSNALTYLVGGYTVSFFLRLFKIKAKDFKAKYLYFYIFPITNILPIIISATQKAFWEKSSTNLLYQNILICITFAVVAIIDFASIFIVDAIRKTDEKNDELLVLSTKNEIEYQNIELIKAERESLRHIKHDIKNIHLTAKELILSGKTEQALEILNQSNNELANIDGLNLCNNDIINTVFYIKSKEAKAENISFNIDIDIQNDVKIQDIDLARILLNLCDNAINATKECDEKEIDFSITVSDKQIRIDTKNPFLNKKKEIRKGHGNGTKIIKEIAQKHGGDYNASGENGIYTTHTTLRNIETNA